MDLCTCELTLRHFCIHVLLHEHTLLHREKVATAWEKQMIVENIPSKYMAKGILLYHANRVLGGTERQPIVSCNANTSLYASCTGFDSYAIESSLTVLVL
jgi:hypothetical protein